MTVTKQALRVYATLQSLKAQSEDDVIDALIPFTMPVLEVLNGKAFSTDLLAPGLKKLYGWNISTEVALVFQKRLEARGYLTRPLAKAKILVVSVPEGELKGGANGYAQELSEIVQAFNAFSRGLSDLLHYDRTDAEALDLLVRFLVTLDMSADSQTAGTNMPELLKDLKAEETRLHADERYICARFVDHISKTDEEMFGKLVKLASVGMLTEVVHDFVEPSGQEHSNLTLVLDAPVALAVLGVSGKRAQRDAELTTEASRKIGCSVVVFEESCNEMARILHILLQTPKPNRFGPTHDAMVRGEVREEYVLAVQRDPEKALKDLGITVRHMSLASHPALHTYFPDELFDAFHAAINWKQNSPPAMRHDAIAMTLTCRLRAGHRATDVFDNRFVFVTNNGAFSRLSQSFAVQHGLMQDRHCPPAVKHSALATAAWLRTGFSAANEIPMAHLLAYCERVLNVRQEVVEQARRVLREITPDVEPQFNLLLQDARSVSRLMDYTLGDEARLTEATVPELLNEMRRATAAELTEEYERKLADQREKHLTERRRSREELQALDAERRAEIADLQVRLTEVTDADILEREEEDRELTEILGAANASAETARRWCIAMAVLLSVGLLGNSIFGWIDFDRDFKWVSWIGAALGSLAVLQQFLRWPQIGLGDLLNWVGGRSLQRRVERAGLIKALRRHSVEWDFGRGESATLTAATNPRYKAFHQRAKNLNEINGR